MATTRFPYGISNFKKLVTEGYHYFDRTPYLEVMEQMHSDYHFFLRPRRFGKSLAVSVMEYYYGRQHKKLFHTLFSKYYIGQNPTPLANKYLVLKFDFSGIETSNMDSVYSHFLIKVKTGLTSMLLANRDLFNKEDVNTLESVNSPVEALNKLFSILEEKAPGEKIFLLIDEYDHFTNEIIAFHFDSFRQIVSANGFVRKFFEAVKEATNRDVIDRLFITGISPVTLDSLTSGFNIGTNLSLDLNMHDFMGFRESEVADLMRFAEVPPDELPTVMADLRAWYNGYLFNENAANRLYNPDMVLYFAMEYDQYKRYPRTLLDANIASDYGKIRRMFRVGSERGNYDVLEEVLENGQVAAVITAQFSFEKQWTRDDFISLLFYLGLLTIKNLSLGNLYFQVPNYVIRDLYYQYFREVLLSQAHLRVDDLRMDLRMIALARDNDIGPLVEALETVLGRLSNRDARRFGEKYIKVALMALIVPTGIYSVFSEYPVGEGYADIVILRRPPILDPKYQFVFELKYLKKEEAGRLEEVTGEGRRQLLGYLAHPDLARHKDLAGYLIVVAGHEAKVVEQVNN